MPEYKDRVATGRVKLSVDLECEEQAGRSGVIGKQPPQESRLPSIVETKGDDPDDFPLSPRTRSRRNLLLPSFSSPVRRTSLGNLLGDELRQFNTLRRCRSPNLSRAVHGQSSSPQLPSKKEHNSSPKSSTASTSAQVATGAEQKPSKLLIPTVTCFGPPELSPRLVDGIEDNGHAFHFNVEHSGPRASTGGSTQDSTQANAALLLETEDVRHSISQLNQKMGTLNQEVSEITRSLQHMMHLLQAHLSVHHYKASYPYGVQMVSGHLATPAPGTPFNLPPTYHLHNDPGIHQGVPHTSNLSYGGAAETQTVSNQSSSPPANYCLSANSAPIGPESMTTHPQTSPPLLRVSPCFQGGCPDLAPQPGHKHSDNRPLSSSPTTISQSQPTLCLHPPSERDEYTCRLSGAHPATSTHSLLDSPPSSYPHLCLPPDFSSSQASREDICVLISAPTSHNLIQDNSILHMEDLNPSASAPTLPPDPLGSSLD
ncbi:hypothetical protein NQZ68_039987 [Dissostichus eleginoides]|nr:hypothetical protein NQZ68_039987 [Dissostichus eleginoides]